MTRNGSGGYNVGNRRAYDAWGVVRAQQSGGDPQLRYCGSLGHKADDESGLVYMRARYYEPASGRFVSQDRAHDGNNWFVYAGNDPINYADRDGNAVDKTEAFFIGFLVGIGVNLLFGSPLGMASLNALACGLGGIVAELVYDKFARPVISKGLAWVQKTLASLLDQVKKLPPGGGGAASVVIFATLAYAGYLAAELYMQEADAEGMA